MNEFKFCLVGINPFPTPFKPPDHNPMKLLKKLSTPEGEPGEVKLIPMDADDMWNLYNLISVGDIVGASTSRKVEKPGSGRKPATQERISMFLYVQVTSIDWDGVTNELRISGTVPSFQSGRAAEYVKHGQYHTLQLEITHDVVLQKAEWGSYDIERLNQACSTFSDVSTAALVMQLGLAHVCLITRTMCPTLAKIEQSIPKKTSAAASQGYDSSVKKFYTKVAEALSHIPQSISCFIIAGPAFVAADFQNFLAANYKDRLGWLLPLVRTTHASTGHKHALLEALGSGQLKDVIKSSNLEIEQEELNNFLHLLNVAENRVYYGIKDINACIQQGYPITNLMILDTLFKSTNAEERKHYVELVAEVKKNGGKVTIFSSLNPTAEQLAQLTGIACVLQYDAEDLHGQQEEEELQQYITLAMNFTPFAGFHGTITRSDFSNDTLSAFIPQLHPSSDVNTTAVTKLETSNDPEDAKKEKKNRKKDSNSNNNTKTTPESELKKSSSKEKKEKKTKRDDRYADLLDFM